MAFNLPLLELTYVFVPRCLWDVVADPGERREVAATNPKVVANLVARLAVLAKDFRPMSSTTVTAGGDFCKAAASRTSDGRQFCGPWAGF